MRCGDFVAFGTGAERVADEVGEYILHVLGTGVDAEGPLAVAIGVRRWADLLRFDETDDGQSVGVVAAAEEAEEDLAVAPPAPERLAALDPPLLMVLPCIECLLDQRGAWSGGCVTFGYRLFRSEFRVPSSAFKDLPTESLANVEVDEEPEEADGKGIDVAEQTRPAAEFAEVEFGPDEGKVLAGAAVEDGAEGSEKPVAIHVPFEGIDVAVEDFVVLVQSRDGAGALFFEGGEIDAGESPGGVDPGRLTGQVGAETVEVGGVVSHVHCLNR